VAGPRVLVIGVGNEMRGDDAVGLIVSRRLREKLPYHVAMVEESSDGAHLMGLWKGSEITILIDAVQSGAEPGRIHKFEAHKSPLPTALFQYSTHDFSIPQAIELARAMNQLPRRLIVYGIEGQCFDLGARISTIVERAAQEVIELLTFEILQHQSLID